MAEKQKHQDGILGTLLRRAATGSLPEIPGVPALTVANAVLRYAANNRQPANSRPLAAPQRVASPGLSARVDPAPRQARTRGGEAIARLNRNPAAKDLAGDIARTVALAPGAARGVWHTVEDLAHAAYLSQAFMLDMPGSELARQQLAAESIAIAQKVSDAIDDPTTAIKGAKRGLRDWRATVDPTATPQAETATGEFLRQFPIGLNQGELGFDVLSTLYGGEVLKPLRLTRFARASTAGERAALRSGGLGPRSPTAADYMARGVPEGMAKYFATPYDGRGHHYWGLNRRLPDSLGGGKLPPAILENPFNVLKPRGLTTGEMHELHYNVDPRFGGGKIKAEFGGGTWSGKDLGWERYGRLGRYWYGAPAPLKVAVGTPLVIGTGAAVDYFDGEEK